MSNFKIHFTLIFILIWVLKPLRCDPINSKSIHCVGGFDPTCFFEDDSDNFPNNRRFRASHISNKRDQLVINENIMKEIKRKETNKIIPEEFREKRKDPANDSPKKKDCDASSSGKKCHKKIKKKVSNEESIYESNPQDPLVFEHLNESDIIQPNLMQYPENELTWIYPPWTYNGFHSTKDWDLIPPHFFASRNTHKSTKYRAMMKDVETSETLIQGRSFMQFGKNGVKSNCTTEFPSPIDIIKVNAREEVSFMEFNGINFDSYYGFTMFFPEDGTDLLFVKMNTPLNKIQKKPAIEKGSVLAGNILTLDRLLIHFGSKSDKGSEHRIDGKSFGMELQFMFTLQTKNKESNYYDILYEYTTRDDISMHGKNQLTLCIFVEVGPLHEKTPPPGKTYNKAMEYLGKAANEFSISRNTNKYRAFTVKSKALSLQDFFKEPFKGLYYTYFGSLTHPPCFNNTRYSVFENPIYISYKTWQSFHFLPSEFSDTGFLANNFRPLELVNVLINTSSHNVSLILPYLTPEIRKEISLTVLKSRFETPKEKMVEYDYYDYDNQTATKKSGSASLSIPSMLIICLFIVFKTVSEIC